MCCNVKVLADMCPVQDGHTKYPVDSDCNFNASQFKRSACTFLLHFLQTRPAQGPLSGPLQDAMLMPHLPSACLLCRQALHKGAALMPDAFLTFGISTIQSS
eukprot:1141525-Pelagomonas_calceolata.AAC.1